MKCRRKRNFIIGLVLIISLSILTACNEQDKENDSVGASPTIEEMSNPDSNKARDEVIRDAIKMSERIMSKLDEVYEIDTSMVFINHEAVLVALKLNDGIELSDELRNDIEKIVYTIYPEAKNIAVSDDDYVYESIAKLLRSYKENDPLGEFLKDLEEIIKSI